jgi:hypothetical protein
MEFWGSLQLDICRAPSAGCRAGGVAGGAARHSCMES